MIDREKQIEEMEKLILEAERYHRRTLCLNTVVETRLVCVCDWLYNAGYRKMDEVTLKLDLGDRSAEEIQQIAEAFANEPTTAILVPSNESEIKKQVAKEILQEFWRIKHGQTELDNVCIRIADKFGLLKELQGE